MISDVTHTVKPVLRSNSKIDKTKILMTNGGLMKVKSIAECSPWSILQYFWHALSDSCSWKPIDESGCFRQVLSACDKYHYCTFYWYWIIAMFYIKYLVENALNTNTCWCNRKLTVWFVHLYGDNPRWSSWIIFWYRCTNHTVTWHLSHWLVHGGQWLSD